jgi:hypothetical protein
MTVAAIERIAAVEERQISRTPVLFAPRNEELRRDLDSRGLGNSCAKAGTICELFCGFHHNGTVALVICGTNVRLMETAQQCEGPQ